MSANRPIIRPGANVARTAPVDACGVLVDAEDYYRAFVAAAREARQTILLSGWQFDSGVPLLRGADAPANLDVRLLRFLNHLCEVQPELEIYILAWDFHVVFALEREWMQGLYFRWLTHPRVHFRFDETAALSGSHHQKFAVIDRRVAFLGGIDLCEARWDDRRHLSHNPLRVTQGLPAKPYHDVQAYLAGCGVADALRELFGDRWARAEGPPLHLPDCEADAQHHYHPRGGIPLPAAEVAFSLTDPRGPHEVVREVRHLFQDAIAAAERLIYIETQYFSSRVICETLVERLRDTSRPRLQVIIIVNHKGEALKEEIAVGLRQARNLELLRTVSADCGQELGVYHSLSRGGEPDRPPTYIHSKLLLVDDRFLSIGSANLTNRSMGVDTELNASWESAGDEGARLERAIRRVRVSLLAEHTGTAGARVRKLLAPDGLVHRLERLADDPDSRLRRVPPPTETERNIIQLVDPDALPFDPEDAYFALT